MTKVVVFSDSHGSSEEMDMIVRSERPDLVFFLGDGEADIMEIQQAHPGLKILAVQGNCDLFSGLPMYLNHVVEGTGIFATHGHHFDVKSDNTLSVLRSSAVRCGAKIVLFGHTHETYCEMWDDLLVINPGSVHQSYPRTYCLLSFDKGEIQAEIKEA